MTIIEGLKAARALVAKPRTWTKGTNHRTIAYRGKFYDQYCVSGAICQVTKDLGDNRNDSIKTLSVALGKGVPTRSRIKNIVDYNDLPRRTHSQILAMFDGAIKLATKDAKLSLAAAPLVA